MNKELLPTNMGNGIMISSKFIADKTGKQHYNVLRDIRNILTKLEENSNLNSEDFEIKQGKNIVNKKESISEILINERIFQILVTGYSVILRTILVDEFNKLKKEKEESRFGDFYIPKNYHEALILAGKLEGERALLEEKNIILNNKIEEDKPKIEFLGRITEVNQDFDFKSAASLLKLDFGRNTLFDKLRKAGILMSNNVPYRKYIDAGYFNVYEKERFSTGIVDLQTRVTQKGLLWLDNKREIFD